MATHLQHLYTGVQREQVAVLLLDNSLQIIQECFLSEGSVTYPRFPSGASQN